MKPIGLLSLILSTASLSAQDLEPFPPTAYPAERYESMKARSPFVLPSFAEEVQAVTADWTSDFRIVSVLKFGDESVVLVKKLSTDERIPVRKQQNAQGIRLVELQMSPDPHNVSAVIEMSGEEGTILYDDSILSQVPRSVAPSNPALKAE